MGISVNSESNINLINANTNQSISSTNDNTSSNSIFQEDTSSNELRSAFEAVQQEQGIVGKLWNGFKNLTGLGLSSNDVEGYIEQYENGEISYDEAYSQIEKYSQKQDSMVDMAANVVSGIAVAGSAVVTGGASLAAGAVIGGAVKAGIKTVDRATNEVEGDAIDLKQIAKDAVTGAVDGAVTVATAGMVKGPIVGQTVKSAVKTGIIQGAKAGVISGAASGAASYTMEAVTEEDVDFKLSDLVSTTVQSAAVGGAFGGVLGGVTGGISQAKFNSPEVVELADNLHIQEGDVEGSDLLSDYLAKNKKVDISELNEYIENVNMDDVYKVAPQVENYTSEQLMNFYDYHYKAGTDAFNASTLSLDDDLTEFLRKNYTDSDELSKLLDSMPATSREVGDMPDGWIANMTEEQSKEAAENVYKAISNFQNSGSQDDLASELSTALGKNVEVEQLGNGMFGTGYKVSVDGADDMVLKVFDVDSVKAGASTYKLLGYSDEQAEKMAKINVERLLQKQHGQQAETQAALFINENSDDFVKMYFGKVSGSTDTDGFLVTQFLDDSVTPQSTGAASSSGYQFKATDAFSGDSLKGKIFGGGQDHNMINGKIIDFGGVKVKETGAKGILSTIKNIFAA